MLHDNFVLYCCSIIHVFDVNSRRPLVLVEIDLLLVKNTSRDDGQTDVNSRRREKARTHESAVLTTTNLVLHAAPWTSHSIEHSPLFTLPSYLYSASRSKARLHAKVTWPGT